MVLFPNRAVRLLFCAVILCFAAVGSIQTSTFAAPISSRSRIIVANANPRSAVRSLSNSSSSTDSTPSGPTTVTNPGDTNTDIYTVFQCTNRSACGTSATHTIISALPDGTQITFDLPNIPPNATCQDGQGNFPCFNYNGPYPNNILQWTIKTKASTPAATYTVTDKIKSNGGSYSASGTVNIIVNCKPTIKIVNVADGSDITYSTTNKSIGVNAGSQVRLKAEVSTNSCKTSNEKWTLSGATTTTSTPTLCSNPLAISNWQPTVYKATLTCLTDQNLASPSLDFFWIAPNSAANSAGNEARYTVTVSNTNASGVITTQEYPETALFNVGRPKGTTSSITSKVAIGTYFTRDSLAGECKILTNTALHFGHPCGDTQYPVGIQVTQVGDNPSGGKYSWIQVANSSVQTQTQIDGQRFQGPPINNAVDSTSNKLYTYTDQFKNPLEDSPSSDLSGTKQFTRTESFTTRLMYQPDAQNGSTTIAVPIAAVDWSWSGNATADTSGNYQNNSNAGTSSASVRPNITDFPVWTDNVKSITSGIPSVSSVASFTPTSGSVGTSVVITGTNFDNATSVQFNGVPATSYIVNSNTQITAVVPSGASTGLITVTANGSGTSPSNFTVVALPPSLSSFAPTRGPAGLAVILTGNGLGSVTAVRFNGTPATSYVVNSDNQITAIVPNGASSGFLSVTTASGTLTSSQSFTVLPSATLSTLYAFVNATADGLYPSDLVQGIDGNFYGSTPDGGTDFKGTIYRITPTGTKTTLYTFRSANVSTDGCGPGPLVQADDGNFYGVAACGSQNLRTIFRITPSGTFTTIYVFSSSYGYLAGNQGALVLGNDGLLYGTIPGFSSAPYGILFRVSKTGDYETIWRFANGTDGISRSNTLIKGIDNNFYGTSSLGIYRITPSRSFTTIQTVSGYLQNLVQDSAGNFYGTVTSTSGTIQSGVCPADCGSIYKLSASGILTTLYTFTGGSDVRVSGKIILGSDGNLYGNSRNNLFIGSLYRLTPSGQLATLLTLNGTTEGSELSSLIQSSTGEIYGTGGPSNVNNGTVVKVNASLQPAKLVINGTSLGSGAVGSQLTVYGKNFLGTTSVRFGGVAATFTVTSNNSLSVTVPPGAVTGSIQVSTPGGSATGATSFVVVGVTPPLIDYFLPSAGVPGTAVVLNGNNFVGATSVKFNGITSSFAVNSNTQIVATVPATASSGPITVTTPAGTISSTSSFTVLPPAPTVTSFTPTSGVIGSTVTITGTSFNTATGVNFNGTATSSYFANSDTQLTALVPNGATTGPITVANLSGSATSSTNFTLLASPVPSITSFSPSNALAGTAVVISGNNFLGASAVSINGVAASFVINSNSQITATVPSGAITGLIAVATPGGTATSTTTLLIPTNYFTVTEDASLLVQKGFYQYYTGYPTPPSSPAGSPRNPSFNYIPLSTSRDATVNCFTGASACPTQP
jgi:uncharacterized repeat protein (TIGR03803 family)